MRGYWVDPSTSLMWAGKDNGKDVSWNKAMKYCRDLRRSLWYGLRDVIGALTLRPQGVLRNEYLNEVNLSGNALREIQEGTFKGLSILEVVDLSRNDIAR